MNDVESPPCVVVQLAHQTVRLATCKAMAWARWSK